ncbi:MAG TPA: adenylosuccinate lyase family protein [Paracoccus sp.]|nr:adenylosuccinate lyase family protein [Paracoccus sp. (in: a-proteobacteria)]
MSVFASAYFRDQFSTPQMRAVFADEARLDGWLRAEVALAQAQAGLGLIPVEAAAEIARVARPGALDLAAMKPDYDISGVAIIPLVRHLGALLTPEARGWLHWGATTQDILDTGFTLQIREALALIADDMDAVIRALASLAARHRDTVMAGRSFQQQAVPVTFGYKVAVWLDEALRHRARLPALRERVLVGQFGGAVGTLAPLGGDGPAVRAAMMRALGLGEASITWHTSRDRWAELVHWLAMAGATLGKIATEITLLMRSEVGELREPLVPGRGGSSTMPQKRNPVASPQIIALARRLRDLPGGQLDAMMQEHERGAGAMPVEWAIVPEAFLLLSGALAHALPVLQGLEVDSARMRANLAADGGLAMAEAVMMALAPHIGRGAAHEAVAAAVRRSLEAGLALRTALLEDPAITAHLDPHALDQVLEPGNYTGSAGAMVDAVLDLARAEGLA